MPRGTTTSKRKLTEHDDDDDEINPEDFFGSSASRPAKPKPKPKSAGRKPKTDAMDVDDAADAIQTPAIGFCADELPDVAKRAFSYAAVHAPKGAKDPGSKEIPVGAPNCLASKTFVLTGEFTSLSRDGLTDLIKTYGGRVTSAVSGKTSYLVVGEEPGSSKVSKAKSLKTTCLREDDLLELIRVSMPSHAVEAKAEPEMKPKAEPEMKPKAEPAASAKPKTEPAASAKPEPGSVVAMEPISKCELASVPAAVSNKPTESKLSLVSLAPALPSPSAQSNELWTEKYKPTKLKDLCGHKTSATDILKWLNIWARGSIPETRAVLISGPPGIGKTTTAHLVAKLAGFDVLELNASETRSKKSLKDILGSAISNHSVLEFDSRALRKLEADQERQQAEDKDVRDSVRESGAKRLVIIMDEVDGMSGGDRGGTTELIQMVKRTKVPIICICNDRQSTKVRSLAGYCIDMRFRRPTEQQMKARLNTIAFRENFKLEPNALSQLVQSTHNDIRQVINLLSSYMLNRSSMSYTDSKEYASFSKKEVSTSPFDVIGKYLNKAENQRLTFSDKLDLYYSDFSIVPLFVQENYIDNRPAGCESSLEAFDRVSMAADLISEADAVDSKLRGSQQWGLMPLHAALSSVGPAFRVCGGHEGMYRFPSWLGQNSKGSKLSRMLCDVQTHMRLRVSADKTEVRKSYIPAIVPELVSPLVKEGASGISDVVSVMDHYYLTKDHWDAMMELHLDGERMLKEIPATVKSAFTREYRKMNHPVAFQTTANTTAGKAASTLASLRPDTEDFIDDDDGGSANIDDEGEEGEEEDQSGDDSLDKDALIKTSAKSKASSASPADTASDSGRGRGRGRGAKPASSTSQARKKRKTE
ncbi:DNA replication factor C complex subunit Rfc1 [Coemansia sp. BCRC 34962]|nr:DNA replication factor C complex subunit Rfc1 [Coemansia sp. BCRC 34962]